LLRPYTERVTDGERKLRSIQRIKVKLIDTFFLQLPYLLDRNTGGDQLARVRVFVEAGKTLFQPVRHGRAALFGEVLQLWEFGDGQDSRNDGGLDTCRGAKVTKPQIYINIEKELRDCP